jgi:hypothetical protein
VVFEEGGWHLHIAVAHVHDLLALPVGKLLEVEKDLRKISCWLARWRWAVCDPVQKSFEVGIIGYPLSKVVPPPEAVVPHIFGEFFDGIEGEILAWGSHVRRPSTFLTFRSRRFHLALFSPCDSGVFLKILLPNLLSLVPNFLWLNYLCLRGEVQSKGFCPSCFDLAAGLASQRGLAPFDLVVRAFR